jgi:hypothetical protein
MPIVKPNFSEMTDAAKLTPGRYVLEVTEANESEKLDKNGHNALVVKFKVVMNKDTRLNGYKVSRWFPLGGKGAKILYNFVRCINPAYSGDAFATESLIGKIVESDLAMELNPKDGREWIKIDRTYPYLQPGSVGSTFGANATDEKDIPNFDDFDTN